jgi:endonuclease/exonuclease/phosphatase family metal-dependent hydrolase
MKQVIGLLLFITSLSLQAAITIGAYNIRNFDYDQRYRIQTNKPELAKIITEMSADVISLQEINNSAEFEKFVSRELPEYDTELSRCGGAHGQRLGFLYNKTKIELLSFNEDLAISNPGQQGSCDSGSRPLAIGLFKIKATGQKFYGISAHLKAGSRPNSQQKRRQQFEIIKDLINELRSNTAIRDFYFAGDLNTTEYIDGGSDHKSLTKLVYDLGMVNLADNIGCSAYWWGGKNDGVESPSHLDHIVVTPGLIKNHNVRAQVGGHCQKVSCRQVKVAELGVSYESVSDHCPISAVIQ